MWSDYRIVKSRSAHKKRRESLFLIFAILFIVICFDADRLVVVAKVLAEQRASPAVRGVPRNLEPECDVAVVIQIEILYRHIGKLVRPIHKTAFVVDDERLQQPVLVQLVGPPCR